MIYTSLSVLVVLLATLTDAQVPVSGLCARVLCRPGTVCRVYQECAGPVCPPRPACVPCVPLGIDAVCNRNNFLNVVLVGNPLAPQTLVERKCNPFLPFDCPFDATCVQDGFGRGSCCYRRPPPGFPANNVDPVCPINQCGPRCPPGTSCQRVRLCPFVPPCYDVFQCRPVPPPFNPALLAAVALAANSD